MAVITINYANLPPSGEEQYGDGADAPYYNTADLDGFTLFNQYRQNPQYGANTQQTSQDYGLFYDGPGFLFQAAGGSGPLSMKLTQDNGSNFSFESIQLDTESASYQNVQVTFTGYSSTGASLGQTTVTLDNTQGPQTFDFSNLNNVSYVEIAPTTVNLQFNNITLDTAPICFASGSRISTTRGEVTVETLEVGDMVVTSSGQRRPVKWLGHRTIDCRHHPNPRGVMPFCVRAHAFGENRPSRDLLLSPGHSVCLDLYGEVLVPISLLANGATIARVDVDTVTYWHIELETHDILLAENLPARATSTAAPAHSSPRARWSTSPRCRTRGG